MRKGISPVIAITLLLMITVSIAGATFFWLYSVQSQAQGTVGTQTTTITSQTSSSIKVVGLVLNAVEDTLEITVQNTGEINIPSGQIAYTIYDENQKIVYSKVSSINNSVKFNEFITLNSSLDQSLNQNDTYTVVVTFPDGVSVSRDATVGGTGLRQTSCTDAGDCGDYCVGDISYHSGSCPVDTCTWSSTVCDCGCVSGSCVTDNCGVMTCDDYCDGDTRYYGGSCSCSVCSYSSEFCPLGCSSGSCIDCSGVCDIDQSSCEIMGYAWFSDVDYPGTYSFTSDVVGGQPSGWTVVGSGEATVISELDGRGKLVQLNSTTSTIYMRNSISAQHSGSIEFWFKTSNINAAAIIPEAGRTSFPYRMFRLDISNGRWYSNSDNTVDDRYLTEISDPESDTWYHITIHWRNGAAGAYQGLSVGRWKVIINGEESNQLLWNKNYGTGSRYPHFFEFRASGGYGENNDYYDAIGYSWDAGYTLGDNILTASCCGDDGASDNFRNSTHCCSNGVLQSSPC